MIGLLQTKFSIKKVFSDIRKIYFLQKVFLASDSFYELLEETDSYSSYSAYVEKFKVTFREMIEKINPELKSYFRIVKGSIADLGGPLGSSVSYNL